MRKERGRLACLGLGTYIRNHEDKPRGRSEREGKESAFEHAEFEMPAGHPDGAETQMRGSERSQDSKRQVLNFVSLMQFHATVFFSMV